MSGTLIKSYLYRKSGFSVEMGPHCTLQAQWGCLAGLRAPEAPGRLSNHSLNSSTKLDRSIFSDYNADRR